MERLLNKKEVLQILGVSMNTLDLMMKNKKLPYIKLGDGGSASVRFRKKDLEDFLISGYKNRKEN